ncbi:M20/M25/M40 family metallo-hydrolase [Sphingomonas sp. CA1-15]|uniref:M20/M25/M40 family metallo-hydrolase n=2 Tax=Sphingomonas immobilis TaxID=3063997 RepID=A0ABT8ZZE4_9SPHN|nr:M20/M25/M40 family metallo-hydrolase [Sphingomonas sp. CA1-15]MDO7842658.1 M20/M25/M40 family metallo-hydrolase [Sphingomonas sp. CA1-15]
MKRLLALAAIAIATPAAAQGVDPAAITRTVQDISADAFQGRAPGGPGETVTIDYLVKRFAALGLQPGGPDGQWTQTVPLLHTRLGQPERFGVSVKGKWQGWTRGEQAYAWSLQPNDKAVIDNAPLVFVGYGVTAPERKWDDFKRADLHGKVAVILVNDPDFEAVQGEPVFQKFGGRTMTYYGRWTYKFEEMARRGAIGALIVHDTPGAGYGWNVVISGQGEAYDIVRPAGQITSLRLQGWLNGDAAATLFAQAGLDLPALRKAARDPAFTPVPLKGITFSAAIPVSHEVVESHNVLAKIPGKAAADQTVMFGAHWDAYGVGPADKQGNTIRRGANDDGIGVAALLEIARILKAEPAPRRTIAFAVWTAEERGLLGSEYYATHPVYPLETTAANLTIDILQTAGKAKDAILVGVGQDSLQDDMARVAATQGRRVTPEGLPERGLFYRADHFSLAKRGVPVLLQMGIAGASDLETGGTAAGQAWIDAYTGKCYHQPCDAWSPDWNLDGAKQDIDLMLVIGREVANGTAWPSWKPGSEFKAIRDKSAALRK